MRNICYYYSMRAMLGKLILFVEELFYQATIRNQSVFIYYILLGLILSIPIIIAASPALILFSTAETGQNSDTLYALGEIWLFIIIGVIFAAIIILLIKKLKRYISLRRYSKIRKQQKRSHRQ